MDFMPFLWGEITIKRTLLKTLPLMPSVQVFIFLISMETCLIICSYHKVLAVFWWSKLFVHKPILFKIKERER